MEAYFTNVDYWHWWILGGVLLIVEMLAPSFFFLWLGIAAGVTGFVLYAFPDLGWQYQLMIFSGLSIVSIILLRRYQRSNPQISDQPTLNRRGEQYIGRKFTLDTPVTNNNGVIRVDDSTWRISGKDMPAGTTVKVTGNNGVILEVEQA